jgi:hypothetical protein
VLGLAAVARDGVAVVLSLMAGVVYVMGAVSWVVSLGFRLTVLPWAAEQAAESGVLSEAFAALDRWAGALYSVHMIPAYVTFAILGTAVLADGELPRWAGWVGIVGGLVFAGGCLATRRKGPFNPPAWAHLYTALLGVLLLP